MSLFRTGDSVMRKGDHSFLRGKVMAFSAAGNVFVRWFDGRKTVTLEREDNLLPLAVARAMARADELTDHGSRDPEEAWR